MRQKSRTLSRSILASIATIFLLIAWTLAQDFQIRTRVDLIVVPVTVKSSGDHLVNGLTKNDFQILEDGTPQTISDFSIDPVPLSAVVLLDTGLNSITVTKLKKTIPALTGAFSAFDELEVYRFDKEIRKLIDFTSDKTVVEAAVDKIKEIPRENPRTSGSPVANPGLIINGKSILAPSVESGLQLPARESRLLHDAIFAAAQDLSERPSGRRRMILVVSDGRADGNTHSYDQAIERVHANNVEVYGIGMDAAVLSRHLSLLSKYAKATGGDVEYLTSTEALERAYSQATDEARNQYVLGYFSSNKAPGPMAVFREIIVKTVRPDLDVLHRQGYYQIP